MTPERREQVEEKFARYGNVIVFMGRHMAGLRAPIFAMAGMHRMPITKFWLWDGLGLCVSAPVVIGIGWWFADNMDEALNILKRFHWAIGGVLLTALVAFVRVAPTAPGQARPRALGVGPSRVAGPDDVSYRTSRAAPSRLDRSPP